MSKTHPNDKLAELFFGDSPVDEANTLLNQAQFALFQGETEKAAELFEQAVAGGRDDPATLLDLAKAYSAMDKFDMAISRLTAALEKSTDHLQSRSLLLALSRAYEAKGDVDKAQEYYRAFQNAMPDLP